MPKFILKFAYMHRLGLLLVILNTSLKDGHASGLFGRLLNRIPIFPRLVRVPAVETPQFIARRGGNTTETSAT